MRIKSKIVSALSMNYRQSKQIKQLVYISFIASSYTSRMSKAPIKLSFYLRLHNGNGCLLNLPPSCTLQRALSILVEQRLTLPSAYRLIVNGKHVRDYSLTIKQLGIADGSIVHIEEATAERIKPISKIDVIIFYQGDKIVVQAQYSDTISTIKQRIYELSGITTQEQLLVFKGRKLNNTRTLQHYRIQPDSLICLSLIVQPELHSALRQGDQLLDSVLSLTRKTSLSSRTTLFRSDSLGERKYKDIEPFDVEFKYKKSIEEQQDQQTEEMKVGNKCDLKNSITFNLFSNQFNPYDCADVYSHSAESDMDLMGLRHQQLNDRLQFEQI